MIEKNTLNLKENTQAAPKSNSTLIAQPWRILVVDDDADIQSVTRLILANIVFKNRPIELISAYSAAEARDILTTQKNIAVALLDVVMETDDAGLELVKIIRNELHNNVIRIILRTGQPGHAPEESVIIDYDINDYKSKNELTAQKLFTAVVAALRAYETIVSLNKTRNGLEKILLSTDSLFKIQSMHEFSSGILTQLSSFLDCKPQGIICIEENTAQKCPPANALAENMKITAVTDEFECCLKCNLDGSCGHSELAQLIQLASSKREHQFAGNYSAFYLETSAVKATIALVCSEHVIDSSDQTLLEVFTSKISIALENAVHYQKMVSLEKAAVTDFLTGLYNRRQLLRLGIPLLAEANRNNPLTVSIINIDFFKLINEKYGHDLGDVVLKQVGQLMLSHFREKDLVSRYGGKEFCIIAPSLPANKAFVLFDNFRQLLENTEIEILPNEKIKVTVSIGITTDLCPNLDDMIAAAESLLYQAKSAGRNCVFVR